MVNRKNHYSWEILQSSQDWLEVRKPKLYVDVVIGVLNGGNYLATVASNILNKPLYWVKAESYSGVDRGALIFNPLLVSGPVVRDKKVLVVDDLVDSGQTMNTVIKYVKKWKATSIRGFVFVTKDRAFCHKNNIEYMITENKDCWIVFPWEKQ